MTSDAALVGALGALIGILLSKLFELLLEDRRRRQKTRDVIRALFTEIQAGVGASDEQLEPHAERYALDNDTPFGTPDETDFVFESIKGDLSLLPAAIISEIVAYYRLAMRSNLMTKDLRDPLFQAQSPAEKRLFVRQLMTVQKDQSAAGTAALRAIRSYAASNVIPLPLQEPS